MTITTADDQLTRYAAFRAVNQAAYAERAAKAATDAASNAVDASWEAERTPKAAWVHERAKSALHNAGLSDEWARSARDAATKAGEATDAQSAAEWADAAADANAKAQSGMTRAVHELSRIMKETA